MAPKIVHGTGKPRLRPYGAFRIAEIKGGRKITNEQIVRVAEGIRLFMNERYGEKIEAGTPIVRPSGKGMKASEIAAGLTIPVVINSLSLSDIERQGLLRIMKAASPEKVAEAAKTGKISKEKLWEAVGKIDEFKHAVSSFHDTLPKGSPEKKDIFINALMLLSARCQMAYLKMRR